MQALWEEYGPDRLVVITWLGESNSGAANQDDVARWMDTHGLTHIVSPGWGEGHTLSGGGGLGLPSMNLIAPGGEIVIAAGWVQDSDIQAALPE